MSQLLQILNNNDINYLLFFFMFFLLGWATNKIYKILVFNILNFFGNLGEKKAKKQLIKNGYEILEEQLIMQGKLIENKNIVSFFIKPDYLVKKNNIIYVAEVKTGKSASIKNRYTRRQLLEYSSNFKSKEVLLVDIDKNNISTIRFI